MSASLFARGVTVVRGARIILDRVDVSIVPGRRTGLVGPNGVGKSTLLGGVRRAKSCPTRARCTARSADGERRLSACKSPNDATTRPCTISCARRAGVTAAQARLDAATHALRSVRARCRRHATRSRSNDGWRSVRPTSRRGSARSGTRSVWPSACSGSRRRRCRAARRHALRLAALLLSRFDVYLLDEPTNDLDLDGLELLEALGAPTASRHDAGEPRPPVPRSGRDPRGRARRVHPPHRRVRRRMAGVRRGAGARPPTRVGPLRRLRHEAQGARRPGPAPARVGESGLGSRQALDATANPTRTSAPSGRTRPNSSPARPPRRSGRSSAWRWPTSRASRGSCASRWPTSGAAARSSPA